MGKGAPEGVGPGAALPRPPTRPPCELGRPGARARSLPTRGPGRARSTQARETPGAETRLVRPRGGSLRCPALLPSPTAPFGRLTPTWKGVWLDSLVAGNRASGLGYSPSAGHGSLISKMEVGSIRSTYLCCGHRRVGIACLEPGSQPAAFRIIWEAFLMLRPQDHQVIVIRS